MDHYEVSVKSIWTVEYFNSGLLTFSVDGLSKDKNGILKSHIIITWGHVIF